ncbi:SpoIIE family protein phosphatase [Thermocatellispora tengchongensis]|uniref:SpoIIE family protein phosphatase n=1 Tax=Thermocatellispora tengchongensis TaxID=1073253 RepID=UPI00362F161C
MSIPSAADESSRLDELLIGAVFDTQAHVGVMYVLDDSRQVLHMETAMGLPATVARAWARLRTSDPMPVSVAVREQRLVWLCDREALAREYPSMALALPYHFALAAFPIHSGGTVWGGFILMWPTGRASELTSRRIDVINDACARMGDLLRPARERGRPSTSGLQPRVLDPHPAHSIDPHSELIALELFNRLPEGYCCLDAQGRVTLMTAPAAELLAVNPPEVVGKRLCKAMPWLDDPVYEDRYRAAIVSHQATRFIAGHPDGRKLSFQCYPGIPGVTMRVTPVASTPEAPPSDAERHPRTIGLHEMLHLAVSLARAVTAQDVVDLVADFVMPVCEAQAVAILSWESGRMRVAASRGYSRQGIERFNGRPVVQAAPSAPGYERDKPSFYATWEEFRETFPDAHRIDDMGAWALLPLVASGQSIGTCVLAYDRPHRFSDSERAMFTALGGLIAQAFERAWLYDKKHRLAESLQESLLPRELPQIPGLDLAARYVPATPGMDIGGDFYDLIHLGDTMAAAVIGDVQGHDMTAAALMGQVRTAIHAHATAGATPGEVLTHTNRLLAELASDRFTSCLYLSLDLEQRLTCLASAGHPPPLLARPGHPTRIIDTSPGLLLGIDPDAHYTTTQVALPAGSILTLYTDGLIEQPGHDLGTAIADLARRFTPRTAGPCATLRSRSSNGAAPTSASTT